MVITESQLRAWAGSFPTSWTHGRNLNGLALAFRAKACGIDWRSRQDLQQAFQRLLASGLVEFNLSLQFRQNPDYMR